MRKINETDMRTINGGATYYCKKCGRNFGSSHKLAMAHVLLSGHWLGSK